MPMPNPGFNPNPYFTPQPVYPSYMPLQSTTVPPYSQPNMQTPQQASIRGYFVNNENDIPPQDVPMDGTMAFFPTSDGKTVIGKRWNGNGGIETVIFSKDEPVQETMNAGPRFEDEVLEKLNDIQSSLKNRRYTKQPQEKREAN